MLLNRKCLSCPTWTICICLWWHQVRTTRQHPSVPQYTPHPTSPPWSLRKTCRSGLTLRPQTLTEASWDHTELQTVGTSWPETVPPTGKFVTDDKSDGLVANLENYGFPAQSKVLLITGRLKECLNIFFLILPSSASLCRSVMLINVDVIVATNPDKHFYVWTSDHVAWYLLDSSVKNKSYFKK